jgi:hypothetical protein
VCCGGSARDHGDRQGGCGKTAEDCAKLRIHDPSSSVRSTPHACVLMIVMRCVRVCSVIPDDLWGRV